MSDVFISYAREDERIAGQLASLLESLGWRIFVDRTRVPAGVTFDDFLEAALEATRCVLVLWSPASVKSRWVRAEASVGMEREILISFALADNVRLPLSFRLHNAPRLPSLDDVLPESELGELLDKVRHVLGEPPRARPLRADSGSLAEPAMALGVGTPSAPAARALVRPARATTPAELDVASLDMTNLDGAAWVPLPAGTFYMGSNAGEDDERPVHRVTLSAFRMSRFPITNRQYRPFVKEMKRQVPAHWTNRRVPQGKEDHPAVQVSWDDAAAYCRWLSERVSPAQRGLVALATEAQWEYAATGIEGREFPWGDDEPTNERANFDSAVGDTSVVGSYPTGATPEGIHDLAGNVLEWCHDWYASYGSDAQSDPNGPARGSSRVLRGGSFDYLARFLRGASRRSRHPEYVSDFVGFRVVWSVA